MKLQAHIDNFVLKTDVLDTEQILDKADELRDSLTFKNMLDLKNDKPIFNKQHDKNTIIQYEFENEIGGSVFVNVEFRWNQEDSFLDTWYTLYVEYNTDCVAELMVEIGREDRLISLINKFIKQANKDFNKKNEKVVQLAF